ncbi:MAG TPA: hypothetical protein GXZ31_00405 [Thermoanaerobacterales bacterium]|nr:hypothetical protein [Thermoanaerobacterales bacterium]
MNLISGKVKLDKKTKKLINRLKPGDIGIIDHQDLDEVAAESLLAKKVKAVINTKKFISGKYPTLGPYILLKAGVFLIETNDKDIFNKLKDGDVVYIKNKRIILSNKKVISEGNMLDFKLYKSRYEDAKRNMNIEMEKFIENTVEYIKKEKYTFLWDLNIPETNISFKNKHALIVVRGRDYKKDLYTIKSYIQEKKPILIGVDGGGDAIMEFGLKPNIIIGDMDSISDKCLKSGAEIIVHAYPDGTAPGLERVKKLGLNYKIFAAPGTSEDIAMLLAFEKGADLIVAVGTHSNMIDFLEKGRNGMSSTFLVRLKVGSILVDAKGVSKLYSTNFKMRYIIAIMFSSLLPLFIIGTSSSHIKYFVKALIMKLKLIRGF